MKKVCMILLAILVVVFCTACNKAIWGIYEKNNLEQVDWGKAEQQLDTESYETLTTEDVNEIAQESIKNSIKRDFEKNLIASGSTKFNPNQVERSSNIRLAASYINGVILEPGEEFSFNNVVGPRTAERGFLPAPVFVGQNVSQDYGGGICQTSSTVCIAVKQTDMQIVEQNPHSQRVSYTTIENEAMIDYASSDFRFVNTYQFPIMIQISFEVAEEKEIIKCDIFEFKLK